MRGEISMLELKFIRENREKVEEMLKNRNSNLTLDEFFQLDDERREILGEVEALKQKRNSESAEIARLKKEKQDATALIEEMGKVSAQIKELDTKLAEVEEKLTYIQMTIPNMYQEGTPVGEDENSNVEIRRWGTPREFTFEPKAHWDIGEDLGILDFERGAKLGGSRFVLYRGLGARVERALINFMLDLHTLEHGYTEHITPFMVKREICEGTGQLPKFEDDMYRTTDDMFLISTSEITMTNIHRKEILDEKELPKYYTAYSPCFRREAGSYGKDVRGLNRLHEFSKVELVRIDKPEHSKQSHQEMLDHVEGLLQKLELPYRILRLCGGDMSFTAALCFDFEVYSEAQKRWLEVSSVSNFDTYQANRLKCRYRNAEKKTELCHTLNGSALALPRIVAALLENNQTPEGIRIPKALVPYCGFDMID